ncbi:protein phosphatase 2C domain-containing protein [Arthrobacter agilis]|uniref:PP2C family protein-serine/threonine phosphatase n=1 Tax=Arthrobacter agilis TaxID=37921 RepID=UPI002366671A|nr:PP2C family serine/threonine-protein phosphatase [Arthrobacter agilis]WDF34309.1 protein phosphatase 2C domain-containing protein [Arthrobacter agilis]
MSEPRAHGAHAVDLRSEAGEPAASTGQDAATGTSDATRPASRPAPGLDLELAVGFGTDRGLRRELNEDSFIALQPVFAVADGMGGHEAGEVASSICVRTLAASGIIGTRTPPFTAGDLEELIREADHRIRSEADGHAGTTLTGVVLVEESGAPHWLFFNVGDSRTYRLSNGTFGQISVDHSEVQELVDTGRITEEQARTHPRRHVVTRALGTGDDAEADFWLMPVEEGDRLLLCSDGLSGEITDEGICTILSTVEDPQEASDELIAAALRSGARDNVTVIVVDATAAPDQDADRAADRAAVPRAGLFAADGGS